MTDWEERYRDRVREFMEAKANPVAFEVLMKGTQHEYKSVSTYGYTHYQQAMHIQRDGCRWIIPSGAVIREETYSMFAGTFTENASEVGLNVEGVACECGKYTGVMLRFAGNLGEIMRHISDEPEPPGCHHPVDLSF